jgi:hypothetical protein
VTTAPTAQYRISGHESFACRYTWLPKAVRGVQADPLLFANEQDAMVELGVGKNMVRSIRFWSQAAGMISPRRDGPGHVLTELGALLLGEDGLDPFLEDIRTLWLMHWNLSTCVQDPLLAWDFLLNKWQDPYLVPSVIIKALHEEAIRHEERLSRATIEQHWDAFLHSYFPTRGRKGDVQEDNLDSPLTELELIVRVGERPIDGKGSAEPVYALRREEKPDITPELFAYALNDFWNKRHEESEHSLPFREIAYGHGSPGQMFKLSEDDIRARVEALARQTHNLFSYEESASLQSVRRHGQRKALDLLREIYRPAR